MNSPAAFMSPQQQQQQQQSDTLNRRQSNLSQQHYGGSMNSAASMRREAPSRGSIHDACAMDGKIFTFPLFHSFLYFYTFYTVLLFWHYPDLEML